jgi:Asp-tRNA(Asn)/Glu-tRNA(Gln) amidotransferase A subunit family amidase
MAATPASETTAAAVARQVRAGQRSVREIAGALADAIEVRDPLLRAFACFDRGVLMESARRLDRGDHDGPLAGVAVAVKDVIDTAQYPTEYGSPIYRGHRPALDAACVALLRQAGALVLGKTVTAELAYFAPGPTRNPHAAGHTPGGSSSGSAAAVAAGLAPIALGTQTAGSVIRPASYCGVVGFKPSAGRIPRAGLKIVSDTLDQVGLFAGSVDDAALLASVLAQQTAWIDRPAQGRAGPGPRVGWHLTSRAGDATPAMRLAVPLAAQRARDGGAPDATIDWPADFDALFDAQRTIQLAEMARSLAAEYAYRRDQLSPQMIKAIEEAQAFDPTRYPDALRLARRCVDRIESLFGNADVILAPSAPGEAPAGLQSTGDPLFNRPWQLLGCPMLNLPFGTGPLGLPLGVTLAARPGRDAQLFAAAGWLEACWQSQSA